MREPDGTKARAKTEGNSTSSSPVREGYRRYFNDLKSLVAAMKINYISLYNGHNVFTLF